MEHLRMTEKEVEVVSGIVLTMRSPTVESVRQCVDMAIYDMVQYTKTPFGMPPDLIPNKCVDLTNGSDVIGLYGKFLLFALAEKHIVSWRGVIDQEGNPISPDAAPHARKYVANMVTDEFLDALFVEKPYLFVLAFDPEYLKSKGIGNDTQN
ncbi:MAG: hypothetical protein KAJ29_03520 [Alphaproteobacteria bacterium]|nr:hypothetical protein [Alphaproteobacteria bacterium]